MASPRGPFTGLCRMVLDVSVLCGQSVAWRALIVWRGRPKKISPEAAHWRSRSWKIQLCPGYLFQLRTWVQVGPQCKIKVRGERNHLADASSQARHLLSPPSAQRCGSGCGSEHRGEEDTVPDIEGPGIMVAKAIDTTPGVCTLSKKRQHVLAVWWRNRGLRWV